MRKNKTEIVLTKESRNELEQFIKKGKHEVRFINRAKILLLLDTSESRAAKHQDEISAILDISRQTVINARNDFLKAESVSSFLKRKKRETPPVAPKVTGEVEAHIIALACSKAPEGYAKWTLRLLAEKCVELQYIDNISHMTVKRLLKKRNLSLI
jgi:glutaredoxin